MNTAIARSLLRIARMLVAGHENYGHYTVDFNAKTRTFTVYFILKDDAVESDALKNAKACRYEIKSKLEHDKLIEVTNIENDHRSFCFTIIVSEDDGKKASFECGRGLRVAIELGGGDDEDTDDDEDTYEDSGGDEGGDEAGGGDEKTEVSPEDQKKFKKIKDTVSKICRKYCWDTRI